jgi:hypothetical protein
MPAPALMPGAVASSATSSAPQPPAGYAFVTTNGGAFVTTNNGADRVIVKVS